MPDAIELMKSIKKAAVDAVKAEKPAEVCFGKVTSAAPLKILVEQKLSLSEKQLILCRNVTDFVSEVTLDPAKGRTKITVHNGLVVGDDVVLLRQQGGQKYLVLDRII